MVLNDHLLVASFLGGSLVSVSSAYIHKRVMDYFDITNSESFAFVDGLIGELMDYVPDKRFDGGVLLFSA